MTRTKKLLWCIGIVFLLCWIPINAINLGNLGSDFLKAEVDGGLLEVGGQLEGLVKASQTYGQLR